MLESKVQTRILKELKHRGIYCYKNIVTNRKGIPDIIVCFRGRFIALEVKRQGGKPTELQIYNIKKIRESGGIARIVYSWEDVEKLLRTIDDT